MDTTQAPNSQLQEHSNDDAAHKPTLREIIMLDQPNSVKLSPSSNHVAISVRTTNWMDDIYETVCYLHTLADGRTYPMNRSGSVMQVEWVDDHTVALLKREKGDSAKPQIWLYEGLVGDGWAVTDHK